MLEPSTAVRIAPPSEATLSNGGDPVAVLITDVHERMLECGTPHRILCPPTPASISAIVMTVK
ncbi:hypothetical protein ABZ719_36075 [Streptomyces sp. NPDC006743]|uniref:hypothetical protein n=1 Tax=Streptomyces sp. NPDC006743 TaxID=3154480 RepID=UPI0034558E77